MATQTEENYLKALFFLDHKEDEITISALSHELDVSLPSANSMVKKLGERGLLEYRKYKPLKLTNKGRIQAALIIRKHRLTEMFLVEKMGFGWEEVHEIAEQVEHVKSPEFFDRMDQLLGQPKFDPHGSPIPDKHGNMAIYSYTPLSECKVGDEVKISALNHTSEEFLKYLNSRDLQLGETLRIVEIEPYDGSMIVNYGDHVKATLTKQVSQKILIDPVSD